MNILNGSRNALSEILPDINVRAADHKGLLAAS